MRTGRSPSPRPTTNAERQRRRRERLRRQGIVDVTVPVPESHRALVREFARRLAMGGVDMGGGQRLVGVIGALKGIRQLLLASGIRRVGVFGSTARGVDIADSDVDIVIHVDEGRIGDILDLIEVAGRIEAAVQNRFPGVRVDVADAAMLKPALCADVEAEAVYAF